LQQALDIGVTFFDTAALYADGENENTVRRAIGRRRHEYVLASKCALALKDGRRVIDGSPKAIVASLEASLLRLGSEHIDIFYLHRLDNQVPVEDSVGALADALRAGKIRGIGLCEVSASTLRRAHAVHPITAVQSEYSPMVRNPEVAILETCLRLNIGFVAFSPMARGLLAGAKLDGQYTRDDIRAGMPRFVEPNLSHNLKTIGRFEQIAASLGLTAAQLSLAWVLSRGPHTLPIPGMTSLTHLLENLAAANVSLDDEVVASVHALFAGDAIRGPRYSVQAQAQADTELLPDERLEA
jgi:aryl-alcohol dehydrogenase-like predicted oxidoreductase